MMRYDLDADDASVEHRRQAFIEDFELLKHFLEDLCRRRFLAPIDKERDSISSDASTTAAGSTASSWMSAPFITDDDEKRTRD